MGNIEDNVPGERREIVRLRPPLVLRRQRFQNVSTTLESPESTMSNTLSRTKASTLSQDSSIWTESRLTGIKVTTESTTTTITLQEETRTKGLPSLASMTGTTATTLPDQFISETVYFSTSTFIEGDSPSQAHRTHAVGGFVCQLLLFTSKIRLHQPCSFVFTALLVDVGERRFK